MSRIEASPWDVWRRARRRSHAAPWRCAARPVLFCLSRLAILFAVSFMFCLEDPFLRRGWNWLLTRAGVGYRWGNDPSAQRVASPIAAAGVVSIAAIALGVVFATLATRSSRGSGQGIRWKVRLLRDGVHGREDRRALDARARARAAPRRPTGPTRGGRPSPGGGGRPAARVRGREAAYGASVEPLRCVRAAERVVAPSSRAAGAEKVEFRASGSGQVAMRRSGGECGDAVPAGPPSGDAPRGRARGVCTGRVPRAPAARVARRGLARPSRGCRARAPPGSGPPMGTRHG